MAKKRGTSKAGKKFIAGMVATAIIAGAGVAGGMAIQNAYADPNAGGDITRLETDLTTEKVNHEATKAELAEVQAELDAEKAKDIQDEARIAELEAKVAELEQQLTRDETKLYFDEFYRDVPNTRLIYLDEDYTFVYAVNYGGAYLMNNKTYVMTRVSINGHYITDSEETDNYVFINSYETGAPSFIYDKSTQTITEQTFDFMIGFVLNASNDQVLLSAWNETDGEFSILWDLKTNSEVCRISMHVDEITHIEGSLYLIMSSENNYIVDISTNTITLAQDAILTEETPWVYMMEKINTDNKVITYIAENLLTGEIKGYQFSYETMTGADTEIRALTFTVYNTAGNQVQIFTRNMVGVYTIESYFYNNASLGTTSASQFSKFAVIDATTGELVEVGTDFVLDETVTELHVFW